MEIISQALRVEPLTLQEKCAVAYRFLFGDVSLDELYASCHPGVTDTNSGSSWWNRSNKVQAFKRIVQSEFDKKVELRLNEIKARKETTGEVDLSQNIDFTNLNEFLAYATTKANLLTEEKDRQFYLKTISDLMRFKEGSQDAKEQEIQRFYTPMQCSQCPLHKAAEEEMM